MITKTTLPKNSILRTDDKSYDYVDSFQGTLTDTNNQLTSTDIGKAFFSSGPKWVEKLFTFRNKIVVLFGLKTSGKVDDRQQQLDNFKCEPGEQMGLFKIFHKTENEVVLGEDDRHLNFRVSLFMEEQQGQGAKDEIWNKHVIISTTVEFNHWFGRVYFLPVRPFHKLIVPTMLKGMLQNLEKVIHDKEISTHQ